MKTTFFKLMISSKFFVLPKKRLSRTIKKSTSHLINSGNSDLVIYLNSLSEKKLTLNKKNKNIVIGRPLTKYNIEPDVFIPCGIPGVDFKGHIFRTDNVVSLPLSSLRLSHSKSVQQVLREIIK